MSEIKNNQHEPNKPNAPKRTKAALFPSQSLSDERRVKVLSPSMLVMKRFIRNKLAITGFVILVIMFLFSFVGGLLMPYKQQQVFLKQEQIPKEYAAALYNTELRTISAPGEDFDKAAFAQFILALTKEQTTFTSDGVNYAYVKEDEVLPDLADGDSGQRKNAETPVLLYARGRGYAVRRR